MIVLTLLFFFFFVLITSFVEGIYAFGLLGTNIPVEIISVLFLLSPVVLLLGGKRVTKTWVLISGEIIPQAFAVSLFLDTRGRMFVSGLGTAGFLVFLPVLLGFLTRQKKESQVLPFTAGLTGGLLLYMLFRVWNSGVDPFIQYSWRTIGVILAAVSAFLLLGWLDKLVEPQAKSRRTSKGPFLRLAGLTLGMISALTLLYFAFESPNVLARWTGASYLGIVALVALAFGLLTTLLLLKRIINVPKIWLFLLNFVFAAALLLAILPHQLTFPTSPEGYPFYEPPVSSLQLIPLYLAVLLSPVIVLDFALFAKEIVSLKPKFPELGGAFLIGSVLLLLLIFAQVFTTVYDYIPVIGPLFRDRFWLPFLLLGFGLTLPILLIRDPADLEEPTDSPQPAPILLFLSAASVFGAFVTHARTAAASAPVESLTVLTYNIQQGYSEDGQKSHADQLELMRQIDPDVIGLQESDTNRIAGGNSDLVRYFADQLNYFSYYGPKVVPGTFGIALLSRYPIVNASTFYMYSIGEQTAAISAAISVNGVPYNIFVTHLGNNGDMVQQEAILQEAAGLNNVILMGDFNFRPDSEQYHLTTQTFRDSWLEMWPSGVDDQGNDPDRRIDHIFISPGLEVLEARYLNGPESDHPAYYVEIGGE